MTPDPAFIPSEENIAACVANARQWRRWAKERQSSEDWSVAHEYILRAIGMRRVLNIAAKREVKIADRVRDDAGHVGKIERITRVGPYVRWHKGFASQCKWSDVEAVKQEAAS